MKAAWLLLLLPGLVLAQGKVAIPASLSTTSGSNTGDVTLGAVGSSANANGASLSGQVLTLQPATASFPGLLTAADWSTFNAKAPTASPTFTGLLTGATGTFSGNLASTVASGSNAYSVLTGARLYMGAANAWFSCDVNGACTIGGATTLTKWTASELVATAVLRSPSFGCLTTGCRFNVVTEMDDATATATNAGIRLKNYYNFSPDDLQLELMNGSDTRLFSVDQEGDEVVGGGARLNSLSAAKPACAVGIRGTLWYTPAAGGAADAMEVCAKAAADTYAWRSMATIP